MCLCISTGKVRGAARLSRFESTKATTTPRAEIGSKFRWSADVSCFTGSKEHLQDCSSVNVKQTVAQVVRSPVGSPGLHEFAGSLHLKGQSCTSDRPVARPRKGRTPTRSPLGSPSTVVEVSSKEMTPELSVIAIIGSPTTQDSIGNTRTPKKQIMTPCATEGENEFYIRSWR